MLMSSSSAVMLEVDFFLIMGVTVFIFPPPTMASLSGLTMNIFDVGDSGVKEPMDIGENTGLLMESVSIGGCG